MQGPCIDANANGNLIGRHAVLANSIAQTIGQFTEGPFLVARNVAAYDALETAVGEYLTLLRFLDAILPEGEKKKEPKAAKKKRPA